MRVLFVVSGSPEGASARYRCLHLAEALRLSSASETTADVVSAEDPRPVRVGRGDIVVLHRLGMRGAGGRFLRAARAVGALPVFSTDDLIFTPDFPHQVALLHPDDPVRYAQYKAAAADFRSLLLACDAVIASTEYLAARVRCTLGDGSEAGAKDAAQASPPVFVARNFLSAEQMTLAERSLPTSAEPTPGDSGDAVTLAYLSGSPTHDFDLAVVAAPLAVTLSRFSEARLLLVGPVSLPAALTPFAEAGRVLRHPFVPWRDLPGLFSACRVDISLAPLDLARPFSHAKSEVKFLEAAAVRTPTVAGTGTGIAEGVRGGEDCLLARTAAEWEAHLAGLIRDQEARRRIGTAARSSLRERGTAAANAALVGALFVQLAEIAAAARTTAGPESIRVRPAARERALALGRRLEQRLMRLWLRGERHLYLLRGEMGGNGRQTP